MHKELSKNNPHEAGSLLDDFYSLFPPMIPFKGTEGLITKSHLKTKFDALEALKRISLGYKLVQKKQDIKML